MLREKLKSKRLRAFLATKTFTRSIRQLISQTLVKFKNAEALKVLNFTKLYILRNNEILSIYVKNFGKLIRLFL